MMQGDTVSYWSSACVSVRFLLDLHWQQFILSHAWSLHACRMVFNLPPVIMKKRGWTERNRTIAFLSMKTSSSIPGANGIGHVADVWYTPTLQCRRFPKLHPFWAALTPRKVLRESWTPLHSNQRLYTVSEVSAQRMRLHNGCNN